MAVICIVDMIKEIPHLGYQINRFLLIKKDQKSATEWHSDQKTVTKCGSNPKKKTKQSKPQICLGRQNKVKTLL